MDSSLRFFIEQFIAVVVVTLLPVLLIAFMTIPTSINSHVHDLAGNHVTISQHMT